MKRDYVNENDWAPEAIEGILDLAVRVKSAPGEYRFALAGKSLAMIFEKSSTRTRVSFEAGMFQLGGLGMFLSARDLQLGRGEPIADTARVLSRYSDGIMARTYAQATVEGLAEFASIPVINGLSDLLHPCQALADYLTVRERFGSTRGFPLCYVGDGNNVAHSLMLTGGKLGARVSVVTPPGFEPAERSSRSRKRPRPRPGAPSASRHLSRRASRTHAPSIPTSGHPWDRKGRRRSASRTFESYRVTARVFGMASPDAIFLHCLPAHRGEEVEAAVIDSPASAVFDQAENRLHAQKALLVSCSGSRS